VFTSEEIAKLLDASTLLEHHVPTGLGRRELALLTVAVADHAGADRKMLREILDALAPLEGVWRDDDETV